MASLQQIISWFQTGLYPTADQFRQTWVSYWHKSEKIPQSQIFGLQETIEAATRGLIYQNPVTNVADLYSTYPNALSGWAAMVTSEGYIYSYNGTDWANTGLKEFPEDVATKQETTIFNVTYSIPLPAGEYYTALIARNSVPNEVRKPGLEITYQTDTDTWVSEKYISSDINNWGLESNWKKNTNIVQELGYSESSIISQKVITNEVENSNFYLEKVKNEVFSSSFEEKHFGNNSPLSGKVEKNGWVELNPSTVNGKLKSFKLLSFAGATISAKICVANKEYIIKSITDVLLTAQVTDLSSYEIEINVGDYVGFYSEDIVSNLKYSSAGGNGVAIFKTTNIPNDLLDVKIVGITYALDYCWSVNYEDLKGKILPIENVVDMPGTNEKEVVNQKRYSEDLYNYSVSYENIGHDYLNGNFVSNNIGYAELIYSKEGGIIESLKISTYVAPNNALKVFVINGSTNIVRSATMIELTGITTDLTQYNIVVEKGDYIGFASMLQDKIIKFHQTGGAGLASIPMNAIIGTEATIMSAAVGWSVNTTFTIKSTKYVSRIESLEKTNSSKVTVEDCNSVVLMGSSLTEGLVVPKGIAWPERINDMVDIPIVNAGLGGKDHVYNMSQLVNDIPLPHDSGNTVRGCHPSYILWENSANGTPVGTNAFNQLLATKEITDSIGAQMLLGTEEWWYENGIEHDKKVISFSERYSLPYSAISKLSRMLYPGYTYPGFVYIGHSGYRSQSVYLAHYDDLISRLPIRKAIKMYRVRPQLKDGSPTISDLVYSDSLSRLEKFVSISCGNGFLPHYAVDTGAVENIDNLSYKVDGGTNTGINTSETSVMLRGGVIQFSKFALIEFIADKISISKFTIKVNCSASPTTVCLRRINKAAFTDTSYTAPSTEFENVTFDYTGDILTIVGDSKLYQDYDKFSVLIKCAGDFSLFKPEISYLDGIEKSTSAPNYLKRKFGNELMPYTDMYNSNWVTSGNAKVASFPNEIAQYTGFNSVKKHIELPDDNSSITYNLNISGKECSVIALRIAAQQFYKIATTRFNNNETVLNSGYIDNSEPTIKTYDYDYGKLVIKVGDNYVYERVIMQGWSEIYIEIPLLDGMEEFPISIGRRNESVDSSYSSNSGIVMIHNVSVQKI